MGLFERYDAFLKRLAHKGSRLGGMARIYIVLLPWFVAILLVRAAFDGYGRSPIGMATFVGVSLVLLVGFPLHLVEPAARPLA